MDNINIVNAGHSKGAAAIASSPTAESQEGRGAIDKNDSPDSAGSFHDSIKKAYDGAAQSEKRADNEKTDDESGGNNVPVSAAPAEVDDRSPIKNSFSIADNATSVDKVSAQKEILRSQLSLSSNDEVSELSVELIPLSSALVIDKNGVAGGEVKALSAQIHPLLKRQIGKEGATVDGVKSMSSTTEKLAMVPDELSTLDAEQFELMTVKNKLPTNSSITNTALLNSSALNTFAQQQTLSSLPTSLLQTASTQLTTDVEGLPGITNTPANSLSALNLQAMPQPAISEALGRPAWSQAMGKQVLMMVNQNIGTAEIRLNPAHLGPIELFIDMSEERVNVSMSSRHAVVREAMEQALPKLREMLEENGFSLADTDISKHSFAEQREQDAENSTTGISRSASDQSMASDVSEQLMQQVSLSAGRVDYYI